MPSALLNWIVMEGPSSQTDFSPIHPATSNATTGMIHTNGNERFPCARATACGISSSSAIVHGIPDEARVEAHGREHRERDDGAEGDGAIAGLGVGGGTEMHERDER